MRLKKFCRYILILMLIISISKAENDFKLPENPSYFFDAIVFMHEQSQTPILDIYLSLPYETLNFQKAAETYIADFTLEYTIIDTLSNIILSKAEKKQIVVDDYYKSIGRDGDFFQFKQSIDLKAGSYKIVMRIHDDNSGIDYESTKHFTIIDFKQYAFSISGIMFLSSMEENQGNYKITPHLSDNISMLSEGFFIFFETYNFKDSALNIDLVYQIVDKENNVYAGNNRIPTKIEMGFQRHFLKLPFMPNLPMGSFDLRLFAVTTGEKQEFNYDEFLAITQRNLKNEPTIGNYVMNNIDEAIEQMVYVAKRADIKNIKNSENDALKRKKFHSFWEALDPTPNTPRNEAFEEYYSRVAYANIHFHSYTYGWKSDQGNVFIVFGQPLQIENYDNYGNGVKYVRWLYSDGREYIFADNTGFGDYRLVRPQAVLEFYQYSDY